MIISDALILLVSQLQA